MRRIFGALAAASLFFAAGCACPRSASRPFALGTDSFAFANELRWEYDFAEGGELSVRHNDPPPTYSLRCFPMVRAAREFFYHAEFRPELEKRSRDEYRDLIREVIGRNSRCPAPEGRRVVIPGFADLRAFSLEHGELLKAACGSAVLSFAQRGNWRMVFPVSRRGSRETAQRFLEEIESGRAPIAHVYRFPDTTLNHGLLIYEAKQVGASVRFSAYDPNDPSQPAMLTFDDEASRFTLERTRYFAGGPVRVYEVYRGAFY
jgi:hypothetical protein